MKPSILLRIAAAVALLQFIAHTSLLLSYEPSHGPAETTLVQAMRDNRFDFGGFEPHSYWQMYIAYGLFAAVNCLIEAVLFWQLSSVARTDPARVRPFAALFLAANLGYATLVALYFFPIPLLADLTIAACLVLVLWITRPSRQMASAGMT